MYKARANGDEVVMMSLCTAAVKSLHPNICIAVHCSIPLHPQLGIMSQLITGDYEIKFALEFSCQRGV